MRPSPQSPMETRGSASYILLDAWISKAIALVALFAGFGWASMGVHLYWIGLQYDQNKLVF
jgi:hypothetical protein